MRSSAILVHFQGHAPCVESLEVTNLFHRRLRFLSWNEQEATIWWHTGRIIRNIISCLAKDVSEHLVKEPPDIPRWHPHPLQKKKRPGRSDWSQPSHASRTDFLDSGLTVTMWMVGLPLSRIQRIVNPPMNPAALSLLSRKVFALLLCKTVGVPENKPLGVGQV